MRAVSTVALLQVLFIVACDALTMQSPPQLKMGFRQRNLTGKSKSPALTELTPTEGERQPVFYMAAMGNYARKHQSRLWLQSLQDVGKWMGDIVMVTDDPACLAKTLGEGLLGGNVSMSWDWVKANDVIVYPGNPDPEPGMTDKGEPGRSVIIPNGKIYILKKPSTTDINKMKQEKTLAWNNIRRIGLNPSYIVYTDEDIVFGKDVTPFLEEVNKIKSGHTLALFKDKGASRGELHTGILILFPGERTGTCLTAWGQNILGAPPPVPQYPGSLPGSWPQWLPWAKKFSKESMEALEQMEAEAKGHDQQALGSTAECKVGKGIAFLSPSHMMFPTEQSMLKEETAIFVHFTGYRMRMFQPLITKEYFSSVLFLPKMEWGGYETCKKDGGHVLQTVA